MKKQVFLAWLLALAPVYQAFAQVLPMDTDRPFSDDPQELVRAARASFFAQFAPLRLPAVYEMSSSAAAAKWASTLKSLDNEELAAQFPIFVPANTSERAQAYYPLGVSKLSEELSAYWLLEKLEGEIWELRAYTLRAQTEFVSLHRIAATGSAKISLQLAADLSLTKKENFERDLAAIEAPQRFAGERTSSAKLGKDGKLSAWTETESKGIQVLDYQEDKLPNEIYKGDGTTIEGLHFIDAQGAHYVIVGFTGEEGAGLELYFYHYLRKKGETRYSPLHQMTEQTKACELPARDFFDKNGVAFLSDVDKNGIAEIVIPYWLDCRRTSLPTLPMQLIFWEAQREGTLPINVDLKSSAASYNFSTGIWARMNEAQRGYLAQAIKALAARSKR